MKTLTDSGRNVSTIVADDSNTVIQAINHQILKNVVRGIIAYIEGLKKDYENYKPGIALCKLSMYLSSITLKKNWKGLLKSIA